MRDSKRDGGFVGTNAAETLPGSGGGDVLVRENGNGSGRLVGTDAIAKPRSDRMTVGLGSIATHAIAPKLHAGLPFDHRRDFTPVSGLWRLPNMLAFPPPPACRPAWPRA